MQRDFYYIVAIAILIGLTFFCYDRWQSARQTVSQQSSVIAEMQDTLKYHRNQEGRLVAEKLAAQVQNAEDFKKSYQRFAEDITKQFDVKLKQVRVAIRQEFEARGSGQATVNHYYRSDSTGSKYPVWKLRAADGYLDFSAELLDSLHAPYSYIYQDTITTLVTARKKWFFGSEHLYSSSALRNKNARITNSTSVLVKSYRDKRWVISVGVSYDPLNNRMVPAVQAGYKLIGF